MNRKKITPKDYIIRKAVKDAIDDFLESLDKTNAVSPRIDGEIPDVDKYIKTFDNIGYFDEDDSIIGEGLVKTYPIDKSINYIVRKYGLREKQIQLKTLDNGIKPINVILAILPNSIDGNTLGDIKHDFQTCGYFDHQAPKQVPNTNYFFIIFEPKFSQDISEFVRQSYQYLYHSTSTIYLDKIAKNGLIPKSKNSLFLYPDRTFLMVGNKLNNKQLNVLKNVQNARNKHVDTNNPIENKEYALITIDVSKLPTDIRFYCDPTAYGAIFTYDSIPPQAILSIDNFTL